MEVQMHQVTKSYHEGNKQTCILENLDITFPSKRFSVILGKSGSGKSSLLNLIGGIDVPDSGTIRIGKTWLNEMKDRDRTLFRRRHLGFIFQFFNLIPTLTVLENVTLIQELEGVSTARCRQTAEKILARVGLLDRKNAYPDNLSGGEQQRVAIARAVVHEPDIILADEPTGNLDHETGSRVLALMLDLIQEKGTTLIMATHSSEALARADQVFSIKNRELVRVTPLSSQP